MDVSIYFNAYDNTGIRFACTSDFFCNQTTTYKSVRNQTDAESSLMAPPRIRHSDPLVQSVSDLVKAGVPESQVCILLETEFNRSISGDEVRGLMQVHGIRRSGHTRSVARKAA